MDSGKRIYVLVTVLLVYYCESISGRLPRATDDHMNMPGRTYTLLRAAGMALARVLMDAEDPQTSNKLP